MAVLTEDEKQLGATVIDMGGGVTSIAVFLEGHMVHADVIPMGGQQVTSDLARMLAAPLSAARTRQDAVRRGAGATWKPAPTSSRSPRWARRGEDTALRVPRSMLTRIIQARLEEIFGQVQTRLPRQRLRRRRRPPGGADRRAPASLPAPASSPGAFSTSRCGSAVHRAFQACPPHRWVPTMRPRSVC
ncbi:MAG: cell division FtsA domain-containing protein [Rhizomicrobium sp.]